MWLLLLVACGDPIPTTPDVVLAPSTRAAPEISARDRTAAIEALETYAFTRTGDEDDRRGQRTNALLVMQGGEIVLERYARGYDADSRLLTWSVTKSMVSTVYGAAVEQGLIDINAPACTYYAPMCRRGHANVRITDLLRMSSGIDWAETYETSPLFSSVLGMLYTRGRHDMAAFTAGRRQVHPPGARWVYSSGDSNILMATLQAVVPEGFPRTAVLDRIGMTDAVWERDSAGTYVGSSYLYATARSLGRWGQLWLNDGVWEGERILAEGWVEYSTTTAPSFYTTPVGWDHVTENPGAQWYTNTGDPNRGLAPPWPALPEDAFGASGHWGKFIWVIPSWDAVVVRMGDDREYACSYPADAVHEVPLPVGCVEEGFGKVAFLERVSEVLR